LTLRNFSGRECALPLQVSNTKHVQIEKVTILNHTDQKLPPIRLEKCEDILLKGVTIQSESFGDEPIKTIKCSEVRIEDLTRRE
jgi:hypothetical protein